MLGIQLLFKHKPGFQSRFLSLPEGEWAGLGKNAKGPAYLRLSGSTELTKIVELAPAQPCCGLCPPHSLFHCPSGL